MKNPNTSGIGSRVLLGWLLFIVIALTAACSSSNKESVPTAFQLTPLPVNVTLTEGDALGVSVPLSVTREDEHTAPILLSIEGETSEDEALITTGFNSSVILAGNDTSELVLSLDIADLPILAHQRRFNLMANDGIDTHEVTLVVNVVPVNAPDVYLLIGQSNMVGFSLDGTKNATLGGPDAPNSRIRQLNVTPNDQNNIFIDQVNFTSVGDNVGTPRITTAEDPLHVGLDPDSTTGKNHEYIGLGLSFAKAALPNTSKQIILVPAAWSGSAFCAPDANGPPGQWNAQPTDNPALGNTWLFDRAVTRTNIAIQETGGILRGILWHQGESDINETACVQSYAANLERMVQQLRLSITPDARGGDLRRNDSNIPFVAGTMSKGVDERDDLSQFSPQKQEIDNAHRSLPTAHTSFSNHDDLVPANGYPCGNTSCIHFGAEALREMGARYYEALLRAANQ